MRKVQRELEDNFFFESKIAGSEQKRDVAEGDILKDIQEVWKVAMFGIIFVVMYKIIFAVGNGLIPSEKEEIEPRRAGKRRIKKWQSDYQ